MRRRMTLSVLASLALGFTACGGDDEKPPGGGGGGGACVPTAAECYVGGVSGPGAECLAKHDNSGQDVWQGRITQITVTTPSVLASQFVHQNILDKGISLNQPACFEQGDGTFSWLFEFNPATNKMKTGGSLPVADPKAGGCFLTRSDLALPIAPVEVDVAIDPDGLGFSASNIDVVVPVFQKADLLDNPILLPLHGVELKGQFENDTHNCIGTFNGETLQPSLECKGDFGDSDPKARRQFSPGATLKGFIEIEEADQVFLEVVNTTLCVYLAGITTKWNGNDKNCVSSDAWIAGERPEGNWCAATNAPADGTCKDAWRLEAEFSASAFKITGDCQ